MEEPMTRCEMPIFGRHKFGKWDKPRLLPASVVSTTFGGHVWTHIQDRTCERCGYLTWRKLP